MERQSAQCAYYIQYGLQLGARTAAVTHRAECWEANWLSVPHLAAAAAAASLTKTEIRISSRTACISLHYTPHCTGLTADLLYAKIPRATRHAFMYRFIIQTNCLGCFMYPRHFQSFPTLF